MEKDSLSVREMQKSDIPMIVDYFLAADDEFLLNMGVDRIRLLEREEWINSLEEDLGLQLMDKERYYIMWLRNGVTIGHSNINKIVFGEEAYMHLHLWDSVGRQRGLGQSLVKMSLPYYFESYQLQRLFCEPMASNLGPNRTLKRVGFELVKTYETVPGRISFLQTVNRWCLTRERFYSLTK